MSERATEDLLRTLSEELEPVRPVPPLRVTAFVLAGACFAALAANAALGLPLPGLAPGVPWHSAVFLAVLLALGALAVGSLLAALAGAIPGRDGLARAGRRLACAGLVVVGGVSLAWCLVPGSLASDVPLGATLGCLLRALGLALLPAAVLGFAVARAYDFRPRMGGVWAALGAVGLGAVAVHASCAAGGAPHVVLGHVLEPLAVAVLIGAMVAPVLRRGGATESSA